MSDGLPEQGDDVVRSLREMADKIEAGELKLRGASVKPITKTIRHSHKIKQEEAIVGKKFSVSVSLKDR